VTEKLLKFPFTPAAAPGKDYHTANKKYVDDRSPQITVSETEPAGPGEDDIWIDTTRDPSVITITASANMNVTPNAVFYLVDCTDGAVTVTLSVAALRPNREYFFKKIDVSGNAVTIREWVGSGDNIDGNTNATLAAQYDYIHLLCSGTTWHIMGAS
jgi:hypothetical protein